jgi:uracil-DNA glycosylase
MVDRPPPLASTARTSRACNLRAKSVKESFRGAWLAGAPPIRDKRRVSAEALDRLLSEIRACRACEDVLPLGPRPVVRARASARILIAGQAPGTRVHETGVPWNDASGERLRGWLGLSRETFYDERRIAIVPMGFCYPGRDAAGGDRPPRPECAPLWRARLLAALPSLELTIAIGGYAQAWHLGERRRGSVTANVAAWRDFAPACFPLPHPSWRTIAWERRSPWFAEDLLPALRRRLDKLLQTKLS